MRAVNGEPVAMYSKYRFDVPIVAPSRDDSPHVADVRKALRDRLVVEFAVRRICAHLPVNAWFFAGKHSRAGGGARHRRVQHSNGQSISVAVSHTMRATWSMT